MKFTKDMKVEELPKFYRGSFKRWMNRVNTPLPELFWRKVDIRGEDECWPFKPGVNKGRYGNFLIPGEPSKVISANRLAWILTNGHIPDGLCVLHKCDYPPCCNPKHLFVGTKKDNSDDMISKGRKFLPVGELSPTAKLSAQQVIEIRQRYHPDKTTYALMAKEYGVSEISIRSAVTGVTWKNIPLEPKKKGVYLKGEKHPMAKLSDNDVLKIRELRKNGVTMKSIAAQMGIPLHATYRAMYRWKHL